jgi:hypothetical protein
MWKSNFFPSAVLARAKEFLPQLRAANEKLQRDIQAPDATPDKFNIEAISNTDGPYIEMVHRDTR